jgi:glucose/arabinose dehydrogenase
MGRPPNRTRLGVTLAPHFPSEPYVYLVYVTDSEQTAGAETQQMNALKGKILRLNPDDSIPPENPYFKETDDKYQAIWAKGCRNPFTNHSRQ